MCANNNGEVFQRLSPLPPISEPELEAEPEIPDIQRGRQEILAIYEAPDILPLPVFAKLAGKSRDQINREIKAGKLFSLSMGNRGQWVPDWQLVPVKNKLVCAKASAGCRFVANLQRAHQAASAAGRSVTCGSRDSGKFSGCRGGGNFRMHWRRFVGRFS